MSRMTKFLKQSCNFSPATRDALGSTVLNTYGELSYETPVELKCRRESTTKDILTPNGSILRASTRYFLDESVVIRADDKLDGRVVLTVIEYTNQLGLCEGYECYV